MQKPADLLQDILDAARTLRDNPALAPQHQVFVNHIHHTAQQLAGVVAEVPPTQYALQRIIPTLGDNFEQQQAVLYGYAKMLLEHPASFDGVELTPSQRPYIERIYEQGMALAQLTHQLKQGAFEERRTQRNAPAARFDLNMLIWQNIPVYRYLLRSEAVKLAVQMPQGLPPVFANPYHLNEIVQHIVITSGRELMAFGKIIISANYVMDVLQLQVTGEGLRLTDENLRILFEQNGRHVYRERMQEQGINLQPQQAANGLALILQIPLASRITSEK